MTRLQIGGMSAVKAALEKYRKDSVKTIGNEIKAFGQNIRNGAVRNAPRDEGHLAQHIFATYKDMKTEVVVQSAYAAFVEFGTKKYAAAYVSTLPADWQQYAASFKGQKGGSFDDLILLLIEWIKRTGIDVFADREQKYDDESGAVIVGRKKRHSKDEKAAAIDQAAYLIARKIVTEGVKAQPFLYPAYEKARIELMNNLKSAFG